MQLVHETTEKAAELEELACVFRSGNLPFKQIRVHRYAHQRQTPSQSIIHFVRHGQGDHNAHAEAWFSQQRPGNPYTDEACPIDPSLTSLGRTQAEAAGILLKNEFNLENHSVEFWSSSLRRTLQTAVLVRNSCTSKEIPITASELLRERAGVHRCDLRAPRNILTNELTDTNIDFKLVVSDPDPFDPNTRESYLDMMIRSHNFFSRLQPNTRLVVVSHSSFLLSTFNGVFDVGADSDLKTAFKVAEVRSVVLDF